MSMFDIKWLDWKGISKGIFNLGMVSIQPEFWDVQIRFAWKYLCIMTARGKKNHLRKVSRYQKLPFQNDFETFKMKIVMYDFFITQKRYISIFQD